MSGGRRLTPHHRTPWHRIVYVQVFIVIGHFYPHDRRRGDPHLERCLGRAGRGIRNVGRDAVDQPSWRTQTPPASVDRKLPTRVAWRLRTKPGQQQSATARAVAFQLP